MSRNKTLSGVSRRHVTVQKSSHIAEQHEPVIVPKRPDESSPYIDPKHYANKANSEQDYR